jgi:hypothetical protein
LRELRPLVRCIRTRKNSGSSSGDCNASCLIVPNAVGSEIADAAVNPRRYVAEPSFEPARSVRIMAERPEGESLMRGSAR